MAVFNNTFKRLLYIGGWLNLLCRNYIEKGITKGCKEF